MTKSYGETIPLEQLECNHTCARMVRCEAPSTAMRSGYTVRFSNLTSETSRSYIGPVEVLLRHALDQLRPLDEIANHDAILSDELRAIARETDPVARVLDYTLEECHKSLRHQRNARWATEGVFRGELKDSCEEMLSRAVSGAEHRLEHFEAMAAAYQVPDRPYAVRMSTLRFVAMEVEKALHVVVRLHKLAAETIDAAVASALGEVEVELSQVLKTIVTLRDNPSQKVSSHLEQCYAVCLALSDKFYAINRLLADLGDPHISAKHDWPGRKLAT